ncbi:hypothetical protein DXG03_002790 [Asterophora parasitica]|uniref:Uncharacterized protein n=1 Tax=Asterophora parasitica TaxID=117018 RepID=A0A9P7G2J8_9AGAR|nr:hypothetical protein DXG03_002790 [Asterophora parasitica]
MALVTISGFPSSGKTRRAEQLRASLEEQLKNQAYQGPISKVSVLSDDVLNLSRSAYDDSTSSDGRLGVPRLDNLLFRYEEPSSMVRWDSPLFTVLWEEDVPPMPQIWDAITKGSIKPPNSGTLSVATAPTDALQALEQTAAAIVSAILADQTGHGGQLSLSLTTPSATLKPRITLPARNITLSELQRLKRQFVTVHKKAITLGTTERGAVDWGEESIASKFVTYLEEHVKS